MVGSTDSVVFNCQNCTDEQIELVKKLEKENCSSVRGFKVNTDRCDPVTLGDFSVYKTHIEFC